jgi:BirA family transcriptional regulator, biotin operon repressor / biotin---[acetyl-CoA-carboxylase] ligase
VPSTQEDRDAAWTALRGPYDPARLAGLAGPPWREVRLVAETGSTNSDLAALARAGEPAGLVLVAELQTAGKGRLGRAWSAPPGACVTASALVRPQTPPARLGWLPLLVGLAVAQALGDLASVGLASGAAAASASVKWPNDVLLGGGKAAGILAERIADPSGGLTAVVLGFGANVAMAADERPVAEATSLRLQGSAPTAREEVLGAVLARLGALLAHWEEHAGDPRASGLRDQYVERCATVGRAVAVALPGGESLAGRAVDVDADGRLVVESPSGARRLVSAGDVVHATHG